MTTTSSEVQDLDGLLLEAGSLSYQSRLIVNDLQEGDKAVPASSTWMAAPTDTEHALEALEKTLTRQAEVVAEIQRRIWKTA